MASYYDSLKPILVIDSSQVPPYIVSYTAYNIIDHRTGINLIYPQYGIPVCYVMYLAIPKCTANCRRISGTYIR